MYDNSTYFCFTIQYICVYRKLENPTRSKVELGLNLTFQLCYSHASLGVGVGGFTGLSLLEPAPVKLLAQVCVAPPCVLGPGRRVLGQATTTADPIVNQFHNVLDPFSFGRMKYN